MNKHPLDYPWDFDLLFMETRKFLKQTQHLSPSNICQQTAKIKILGGYTSDILENWIRIFAAYYGVIVDVEASDWGSAFSMDINGDVLQNYDLVVCLNNHRDLIINGKKDQSTLDYALIETQLQRLINKVTSAGVALFATTFDAGQAGPPSTDRDSALLNKCAQANSILAQELTQQPLLTVFSPQQFSTLSNEPIQSKLRDWYQFGHCYSIPGNIMLAQMIARHVVNLKGLSKKALVVDLDNTLWGGVIGDDGVSNIELGQETPRGRIFSDIQSYVLHLKERGVLLAISSKNNEDIAKEGFNHPASMLKWSDFSYHAVNWDNKSTNIRHIANALNIGLDSLVFIDDNPVERAEVRINLPMVTIPDCGEDPEDHLASLMMMDPFSQLSPLTKEDLMRNDTFRINEKRDTVLAQSTDHGSFLKSIETTVVVKRPDASKFARVLQLTNKTNQFNLTGKRLSQNEFNDIIDDPKQDIFVAHVRDTFGEYGLTGVMYICREGSHAHFDNWLMSCRVFSKTAEHAMFKSVALHLLHKGIKTFSASFSLSEKNAHFQNLWSNLGFAEAGHPLKEKKYGFQLDTNVESTISEIKHFCKVKNEL